MDENEGLRDARDKVLDVVAAVAVFDDDEEDLAASVAGMAVQGLNGLDQDAFFATSITLLARLVDELARATSESPSEIITRLRG